MPERVSEAALACTYLFFIAWDDVYTQVIQPHVRFGIRLQVGGRWVIEEGDETQPALKESFLVLGGCVKLKVIRVAIGQFDFDQLLLQIVNGDAHEFQRQESEMKGRRMGAHMAWRRPTSGSAFQSQLITIQTKKPTHPTSQLQLSEILEFASGSLFCPPVLLQCRETPCVL